MFKQRIHLFDLVSDLSAGNENKLFTVVGRLRVGELEELEGLWQLKDFCSHEEHNMVGRFLRVWKCEEYTPEELVFKSK